MENFLKTNQTKLKDKTKSLDTNNSVISDKTSSSFYHKKILDNQDIEVNISA